jgi:localization factor PodJL
MKSKPNTSNAKAPTSWQIKGVNHETRAAVKAAARRSGKTMGTWVNDTLHKAATAELTGETTLPAHRLEEQLKAISGKIDAINRPFWGRLFKR